MRQSAKAQIAYWGMRTPKKSSEQSIQRLYSCLPIASPFLNFCNKTKQNETKKQTNKKQNKTNKQTNKQINKQKENSWHELRPSYSQVVFSCFNFDIQSNWTQHRLEPCTKPIRGVVWNAHANWHAWMTFCEICKTVSAHGSLQLPLVIKKKKKKK